MQDNLWLDELARMKKLLNWKEAMPVEVLYSIMQDAAYAEKIMELRNNPIILRRLLNSPTKKELRLSKGEAEERMETVLHRFETILPLMEKQEGQTGHSREVYMDNNSTTKIRPEVQKLMSDYAQGLYGYGNPSSVTRQGSAAANLIQAARMQIAKVLKADSGDIFFTGSGTESNNLAIKGLVYGQIAQKGHIITTMAEHASVLEPMKFLESAGFCVTYLKPDRYGCITASSVLDAIRENTILVSVMAANNEIGTLYPVHEIGRLCKEKRIPFMVDGIQAFGKIPLDVKAMNITLLTFSAHKLYGPKGVGGICIKNETLLTPLLHGGGQEKGIRSGTENVGHIMAFGLAAELAERDRVKEMERQNRLRKLLRNGLEKTAPDMIVYGSEDHRLSGLLSVGFHGINQAFLIHALNRIGVSVSSGSACSSKKKSPSHVMEAIGADTDGIAVIRFGLGMFSSEEEIAYVLYHFQDLLTISRQLY